MSLGKLLLRPQLVTDTGEPTAEQLGLSADFIFRLSQALVADPKAQKVFQETFELVSGEFIRDHSVEIEQFLDHLLGWVQPFIETAEQLSSSFDNADPAEIPGIVPNVFCLLMSSLSPSGLDGVLTKLLDDIESDLQTVISDLPVKLLGPILDQLKTGLQEDYLAGDDSSASLNRYMLGRDIGCMRSSIMTAIPSISFDRELILQTLSGLLAELNWEETSAKIVELCQTIQEIVPNIRTLFSFQFSADVTFRTTNPPNPADRSFNFASAASVPFGATAEETPRHYLWYASWLLGKDLFQQGDKVFEDDLKLLFKGDGLFRASLENVGELLTVRETFAAHDRPLSSTVVVVTEEGKPIWLLHDTGNEKLYTIIIETGQVVIEGGEELSVYEGRVYLETDWTKIDLLRPYTFKRVIPSTCDLLAWIMNFGGEFLELILHAASIESKDFVSNLLNLLIHGTFGSLKVVGPRGFGWTKRDLPMRNPWLNWVMPIGVTTLASLEGIHTKDEAPHAMIYWLTLLGADLSEKFLYDHWAYMLRDGLLSTVTLLNYDGAKADPDDPKDTRPFNRKHTDGVVNLFVEGGVWIVAALYPKSDFGFPNKDNMGKLGLFFGHWFGFGALTAVIANLVGSSVAWALGWVIDWKAYGWMNLKAYVFVLAKYSFYQYFTHDGKTNGGKFDGSGDTYPGYPADRENSPYRLPYERETTYACAQGNLGIWSHTAHSNESQIYALDFAMDKGDVVLASRGGVVDDFDDTIADHDAEDGANYIRIRHGEFQSESYGSGDGATLIFPHTLGTLPVLPGSVFITDTVETFSDDSNGTLTGSAGGAGTVNYTTGQCSVTFNAAPADGQAITAVYVHAIRESYGTGDGTNVAFAHTLGLLPVQPGSVFITDTVETFTDDTTGTLTGSSGGTGTIDYATGVCSITFNTAPASATAIFVFYVTVHPHDRDRNNVPAVTYANYLHGTNQGISELWAEKLGINVAAVTRGHIVGQAVQQGEPIMKAGDTGRSAYNHLHMHIKPQIMGSEGNYTIPFVFADVDGDGVPKSLDPYESDNERR